MKIKKHVRTVYASSMYETQNVSQHNETILSLQYSKLSIGKSESDEEWMGYLT